MKNYENIFIDPNLTLKEAMKVIDTGGIGIAFVINKDKKLLGTITDGDIRRTILRGKSLNVPTLDIMNKNPIILKKGENFSDVIKRKELKERFPHGGTLKLPIVDDKGKIIDISFLTIPKKEPSAKKVSKGEFVSKVLLIGGAGYIGSVLVKKLIERGYDVKVLDKLLYDDEGIKRFYKLSNFEFVKGDILNIDDIVTAMRDVDAVIHLAAIVGDPAGSINPEKTIMSNYLAVKAIAEACKNFQINRFIFASTCSVYGASSDLINEDSVVNPLSLYSKTKLESEKGILSLVDENFAPTILRLATVYGVSPRMRFDLAVNIMTAKAIKENKIIVHDGKQWRPFVHIEDVADAFIKVLESPIHKIKSQIFNVGSNKNNYKIIQLGKIIQKQIPNTKLKIMDSSDKRNYKVNFTKIKSTIKFVAKRNVVQGINEIKNLFDKGIIKNYKNKKYHNYLSLVEVFVQPVDSIFSLRIDIDTKNGLVKGVPKLLDLLDKYNVKASFYIPMGKESNIFDVIKHRGGGKRFARWGIPKMSKIELARRIIMPLNPAEKNVNILKEIIKRGYKLGVHGWKHRHWTRALDKINVEKQFIAMTNKYKELFGKSPKSFAAPGFRTNFTVLSMLDKFNFEIASDMSGDKPFRPRIGGKMFEHIQVPINIRVGSFPFIEYYDLKKLNEGQIISKLKNEIKKRKFATMYIHADYEGIKRLNILEEIFKFLKEEKIPTKTIEEIAKLE